MQPNALPVTAAALGSSETSSAGLRRELGLLDVSFITFNSVVGSAIFIAAAIVPRSVSDPSTILALWVLGGLLSLAGVATYAELGTMFPQAGGQYVYLKEAYGPLWGFLLGWTAFFVIQTGAIAYLAIAASEVLFGFVQSMNLGAVPAALVIPLWGEWFWILQPSQLAAAGLIVFVTAVNYAGLRAGAGFQNAIAIIKIASLLAFVAFGLAVTVPAAAPESQASAMASTTAATGTIGAGFAVALIGMLWCYDGWSGACSCAGEIRDPGRNLVRGMVIGTMLTAVLYVFVNFVYLRAMPPEQLGQAARIGEAVTFSLFGPGAAKLMSLAIAVSTLGCLASTILAGARIYLPMAQDRLFFSALARVHPVHRTPGNCLVAQAAWSIVLAFTGSYEQLGVYVIFAVFLFHAATGFAVFVLRRTRPEAPRPYRAWLYPWTPLLVILTSLAFVASTLWERPIESLWGIGLVLLGLPAYWWWRRDQESGEQRVLT